MNRTIVAAFAALALLTGCTQEQGSSGDAQAGSNRPSEVASDLASPTGGSNRPTEEPTQAPEPEPTEEPVDGPLAFGGTFQYEDGLAVTVGVPQPYTPSEYAAGTDGFSQFVGFDIVVLNGTQANFDPSMFTSTLQSANVEGSEIYDQNVGGGPSTTLLPGREARFRVAYAVTNPADLVLEVSPSFEHEAALFTNTGQPA